MDGSNNFKYKAYTPKSKGGGTRKSNRGRVTEDSLPNDKLSNSFNQRRQFVRASKWFKEVEALFNSQISSEQWPVPKRLIALGLGSFESNVNAVDQLVLLEYLADRLQINSNKVTVFDPVSTEFDIQLLDKFGYRHTSEHHTSNTNTTTLLYMPHCDKSLYESTLKSYWNSQTLPSLVLLGNDLSLYSQRQKDTTSISLVSKFLTFSHYSTLPTPPDDLLNSFNELCVQYLPQSRSKWLSGNYWEVN